MTGLLRRTLAAALAGSGLLLATPAGSQQPTLANAQQFIKTMLISQNVGIDNNGGYNGIQEVGWVDDCTMGMSAGGGRFFVLKVDFRMASIDPLGSGDTLTQIVIERGVTIYKQGHLLQPEGSSTIDIKFGVLRLGQRVMNALNVVHQACYQDSGFGF